MKVLVIEDSPADVAIIRSLLLSSKDPPMELVSFPRLATGLEFLSSTPVDLILLDLSLPDSHGLESVQRTLAAAIANPVIVLTGQDDDELAAEALREGVQDYLIKSNLNQEALLRSIRYSVERKRSALALRESEKRYRLLEEASDTGVWDWDLITNKVYFSPTWKRQLGHGDSEVPNLFEEWERRLHPDDRPRTLEAVERFLTGQSGLFHQEFRLLHKDGSYRWILSRGGTLRDADDKPYRFLGTHVDITESKKVEEDLRRLGAAINQSAEIVLITDLSGSIEYANPAFEHITGYTFSEIKGRKVNVLKSGQHSRRFYQEFWKTILGGQVWRGRFINRKKDGTLYTQDATVSPIVGAGNRAAHFVLVGRDITHEIELESQVRQMQKMEAIGHLAGGIAHDFNNSLQVILAYTQFALRMFPPSSAGHEDLSRVVKAATRAADLTRQLLAFGRKSDLNIAPFDIEPVIKELIKFLEHTIPASIAVSSEIERDLPEVVADATQVHQVLMNLCLNARDAMPHGGRLLLKAAGLKVEAAPRVEGTEIADGDYVEIEVRDTGVGIPPEIQPRIFEPFFTTKEQGKGTGLGLASTYGIVRQHGGMIRCQSQLGEGTSFKVYLPAKPSRPQPAESTQSLEELPRGSGLLLVAEDQEPILQLTARCLEELGYTVLRASNGEEALNMFSSRADEIRLVLLDMQMPVMDGERCFKRIQAISPRARVVVASGFVDSDIRQHLNEIGVREIVQKPYRIPELARIIRRVLDSEA
ncbi:MAG: response regulator [Candidatus Omnitrophica bacterium]|nr:response regulator [Candidatus Omnitrophota bacterium]